MLLGRLAPVANPVWQTARQAAGAGGCRCHAFGHEAVLANLLVLSCAAGLPIPSTPLGAHCAHAKFAL